MLRLNFMRRMSEAGMLLFVGCLLLLQSESLAIKDRSVPVYAPVVNGEALRGLSSVGSAESMGAGRITVGVMSPWYHQQRGYLTTPNIGANLYTIAGAFSYGVNDYVDLFTSIAGFTSNNYTSSSMNSGLGTIRAGAQGSLPFPGTSAIRIGGQTTIIGGTSQNQINTYRADGYNYFETRTGYDFMGKVLQTIQLGSEDWGVKAHLNEGVVFGMRRNDPVLLLLGAGFQANFGFAVVAAELNSRTMFNSVSFMTDPLWFTPSVNLRTPYNLNGMVGVDISLSQDRPAGNPRALEPYRVFGAVAFSIDALAGRRAREFAQKEKEAREKAEMEQQAAIDKKSVDALTLQSSHDSATLAKEKERGELQRDSMQQLADQQTQNAEEDARALKRAAEDLAAEQEKRSDAEKQLLSTGELLLDAVYFTSGTSELSINSKPYLNVIGRMLLKYPKLQIEVAGHTDNVGAAEYNVTLSKSRAEAVRMYLVEVAPMLGSFLNANGYGMSAPRADNNTKEGRQANRRVELRVLNKGALSEYSLAE